MCRHSTRKSHKKSRDGCLPCKSRHVKCDEQQPQCANCVKQSTPCEYRPMRSVRSREASRGPHMAATTPTTTPSSSNGTMRDQTPLALTIAPIGDDTAIDITQLRLLYHYTNATAKTLGTNRDSEEGFATTIVELGFDHPYLLHAIFAITALHMYYLEDQNVFLRREHWILATQHHDASLSLFQAMVRDIDSTNYKAVLLFANALFPYSCVASIAPSNDVEHAFNNVFSSVVLTRKMRPMARSFYYEMRMSELGCLIPDDVKDMEWDVAETPTETELVQLRKFSEVVNHIYPPDIVDAYGVAIRILELVFEVNKKSSQPPSDALLKIWLHVVPDRYVELLSEKQPGSLIIFAHYAVMVHRGEHYWFMVGVAEQILKIADALVPTEWRAWLDWPKQQIRGTTTSGGSIFGPST